MLSAEDVASSRHGLSGLSDEEAAARLRLEGPNVLQASKPRRFLAVAGDVVREPMILLLLVCASVYLLIGDLAEALALAGSILLVIGISVYQNRKAERALEALRDLSAPRARVLRGGVHSRIPARDVVRDDLLFIAEGDRVPADAVLLQATNVTVDESLLTGESLPVRKVTGREAEELGAPGGDDTPFVFSGTLVVTGDGAARVKATGARTRIGAIGKALATLEPEETVLESRIRSLVRKLALAGLGLCVALAMLHGLARRDLLGGILAGLALAMAMLPEEFPVILALFLALGAWRISRRNVLTRRMPAIESLGSATVLCLDKTGTLTENRMSLALLCADGRQYKVSGGDPLPPTVARLLELAFLASRPAPFDRMEQSLHEEANRRGVGDPAHEGWSLVREYPMSPELLAVSHVWAPAGGGERLVAMKGAPETVGRLCRLGPEAMRSLEKEVASLASEGYRVLGVGAAPAPVGPLPGSPLEYPFRLTGLLAFVDPIRAEVPETIAALHGAGIRTVMITGDHPGTALSIAKEAGLGPGRGVLTGPELGETSDEDLLRGIRNIGVFARVVPEQKLRIVSALKSGGDIVAMTGDGVNDAPALKAAHVGVAMGQRGTDVAREAAALVLLDDNISSLVHAVRLGRRILDNIKKAMIYVLAIHVPIAGLSLLPVVLGLPIVLLPLHIVFLELIIDPVCSIAFEAEPEDPDVMTRAPRDPREPLFLPRALAVSLLQGAFILALALGVLFIGSSRGYDDARSRTLAFSLLVLTNVALILVSRTEDSSAIRSVAAGNRALWLMVGGTLALLAASLGIPWMRRILRLELPGPGDVIMIFALTLTAFLGMEIMTLLGRGGRSETRPPRRRIG